MEQAAQIQANAIAFERRGEHELAWSCYEDAAQRFQALGRANIAQALKQKAQACRQSALSDHSNNQPPNRAPSASLYPAAVLPEPEARRAPAPVAVGVAVVPGSQPVAAAALDADGGHEGLGGGDSRQSAVHSRLAELGGTMRPWVDDFAHFPAFSLPPSTAAASARVKANLHVYKSNYIAVCLLILAYVILTSPVLIVGCVVLFALHAVNRGDAALSPTELRARASTLSPFVKLVAVVCVAFVGIYFLTSSISSFVYSAGIAAVIVLAHATLHASPFDELDDDEPDEEQAQPSSSPSGRHPTPSPTPSATVKCLCCRQSSAKRSVLIPCGHVVCAACAGGVVRTTRQCPLCHAAVRECNRVFA